MSIRQDFLKRLIERAGPFLKRLLALKQEKKAAEAAQVLQQALRELVNLDARLALSLSADTLRGLLSIDEGQAPARRAVAADLLAAYADCLAAAGDAAAAEDCRAKASRLRE